MAVSESNKVKSSATESANKQAEMKYFLYARTRNSASPSCMIGATSYVAAGGWASEAGGLAEVANDLYRNCGWDVWVETRITRLNARR